MPSKKIFTLIALFSLSFWFLISSQPARGQTVEELQAQIERLQQLIQQLQQQLQSQLPTQAVTPPPSQWCYNFNVDLYFGKSGRDVSALQIALEKEGFTISSYEKERAYFGDTTLSAVIKFQEKYASEILTPLGLVSGTGYVGASTRAKLNQLYGCIIPSPPLPPTVPSIAVVSPNGGEVWEIGKTYEIKWRQQVKLPPGEKMDIFLVKWAISFPSLPQPVFVIATGIPVEQESYSWTIPSIITPGRDYAVFIQRVSPDKKDFDWSDRPFTITYLPAPEDPVSGTLSVDKTTARVGEEITLTITAKDLQGVYGVSAFYQGKWDFKSCDFATTCTKTFTFAETKPGTYTYRGYVYGRRVDGRIESRPTTPSYVTVKVTTEPTPTPVPAPSITSVWPTFGTVDDQITIYGRNLIKTTPSGIRVEFLEKGEVRGEVLDPIEAGGTYLKFQLSSPFVGMMGPGTYQIRVVNDNGVSNTLNFTIYEKTLTLISPNGGERWEVGKRYEIRWRAAGVKYVDIVLERGATQTYIARRVPTGIYHPLTETEGRYLWAIPTDIPPADDYYIKIWDSEKLVPKDASDGPFSIVTSTPTPFITVISPNGGERWVAGTSNTISWRSTGINKVNIYLVASYDEGEIRCICPPGSCCCEPCCKLIASNIPANLSTFVWNIPANERPTNKAKIAVASADSYQCIIDYSDNYFSIVAPTTSVTVISPNGGEEWEAGKTYTIKWSMANLPKSWMADVYLVWNGGASSKFIGSSQNATGIMYWRIPLDIQPRNDYKIRVEIVQLPRTGEILTFDESDAPFSIVQPAVSIRVRYPNGGETFTQGSYMSIYWETTPYGSPENITLELLEGGTKVLTIGTVKNTGYYYWQIPSTVKGDLFKIRAKISDTVYDDSDGNFSIVPRAFLLSVWKDPAEGGTVVSLPKGIDCGSICSSRFPAGTKVVLTASPAQGYSFVKWVGCDFVDQEQNCNITLNYDKGIRAYFEKVPTLTIALAPDTPASSIISPGNNIPFLKVTLSASGGDITVSQISIGSDSENAPQNFANISVYDGQTLLGRVSSLTNSHPEGYWWSSVNITPIKIADGMNKTLTITSDVSSSAVGTRVRLGIVGIAFINPTPPNMIGSLPLWGNLMSVSTPFYTLSVYPQPSEGGKIYDSAIKCPPSCSAQYPKDSEVTLSAIPNYDYTFVSWSGCDYVSQDKCIVRMTSNKEVKANFAKIQKYTLWVYKNVSGGGTVRSQPYGIICDTLCRLTSYDFAQGTVVTLFATPAPGYVFKGWSGDCSGTSTSCTLTIDKEKRVYATFDRLSYTLTVNKTPTTGGTITSLPSGINCGSTCSFNFAPGTKVTLIATPAPGYAIISQSSWYGCDSNPSFKECIVTMNSNKTVSVIFTPVTTPTPTLPDLIVSDIYYQSPYIYVKYCNIGSGWSSSDFLIKLRNNQTGQEYGGNVLYRFKVPQPGECKTTGGYTPSLIGLAPGQSASITAIIDWEQRVRESNENNNALTKTISLLSLRELSDWLAALEAAARELQKLLGL